MQVNSKSQAIVELLGGVHGALKAYAMQQLATAFLDLSEKAGCSTPRASQDTKSSQPISEMACVRMKRVSSTQV